MSVDPRRWVRGIRRLLRASAPEHSDAVLLRRFAHDRDEAAFAALVERHGGLVFGVCRRVLGERTVAEDCAQATFLVLARKAAAIRRPERLAGWLYGTAYRLASRQRRGDRRRLLRDAAMVPAPPPTPDPLTELTARELVSALDEELHRLPDAYRLPLILCALEGLSQEEAAARLGWSAGSVRGRLERGRARLKERLRQRGLSLSVVMGPASLGAGAVPQDLACGIVRSAAAYAAGSADLSPAILSLVKEELRLMSTWKIKTALALVLTVGVFAMGFGWLTNAPSRGGAPGEARAETVAPEDQKPAKKEPAKDARAERIDKVQKELRQREAQWDWDDRELSDKVVEAKMGLADLEEQLRANPSDRIQAEIEGERTRLRTLRDEQRKQREQFARKLALPIDGDVEAAEKALAAAQKRLDEALALRLKLRRDILTKEEAIRRLEQKRADRREWYLRQRDDDDDRLRRLEGDGDDSDRAMRSVERRLDAIQRELSEMKRELRKLQESAKKQR